jgi:hypothetical protein
MTEPASESMSPMSPFMIADAPHPTVPVSEP